MKVSATTFYFSEGGDKIIQSPHKPTSGATLPQKVTKAVEFVKLNLQDGLNIVPQKVTRAVNYVRSSLQPPERDCEVSSPKYEGDDNEFASRFLMMGQCLCGSDVMGFSNCLEYEYKSASVKVLFNCLGDCRKISLLNPFYVVTGRPPPSDIDKNWMIIDQDGQHRLEDLRENHSHHPSTKLYEERYIVYPFVYPGSLLSLPHIVLIIIDQKKQKIYYYDSQGLTSNDPCRKGVFEDDPDFDMHKNLKKLAKFLFGSKGKVSENISVLQTDPVNCGIFICRALEGLYKGFSVRRALHYDFMKESISYTRKRIGLTYIDIMNRRFPKEINLNIVTDYYSKPNEHIQSENTQLIEDCEWD